MKLNNNKRNFFEENGFVILKNIISKKKINQMQKAIISRSKICLNHKTNINSFNDKNFHKDLIKLKKNDPKKFGSFYDSVQKSLVLYSILTDKKLISKVCFFSKLKKENISINGENIRMDLPYDKLHKLDWHQDRSYYFQNRDGNKGLVIWIPLINITNKIGPMKACEKSHKLGFISNYQKKISSRNSSTQRSLDFDQKNFKTKGWSRCSTIPYYLIGFSVFVYSGKEFRKVFINREKVGFKFGEFVVTRKQKKKK
jgi:ribosomal protein S19